MVKVRPDVEDFVVGALNSEIVVAKLDEVSIGSLTSHGAVAIEMILVSLYDKPAVISQGGDVGYTESVASDDGTLVAVGSGNNEVPRSDQSLSGELGECAQIVVAFKKAVSDDP